MLKYIILLCIFFYSLNWSLHAQDPVKIEKTVGKVDTTQTVTKKKQILPVLLPVTEPAVGYGAIGGILYLIPKKEPDILVALTGLTSNGSWFAGGGYIGFWKDDKVRYRGLTGYGKLTLDYYISNKTLQNILRTDKVNFDQKVFIFLQQLSFRLGDSDFFLGAKYQFSDNKIPHHTDPDFVNIFKEDFDFINSGITAIMEFDNLNNFLSPTKGSKISLSYLQNLEFLGSNRNWGELSFSYFSFLPINSIWTPAIRIESNLSTGKQPFYSKPYVSLRGIPAMRYQSDFTALIETEQLFDIKPRWGMVAFAGIGAAFESYNDLDYEELAWNVGAGIRFLAIRDMGTKVGVDIARGPEDWAFYVNIGYSWLR
ncbi:MAG: BamA/TamA family outer membrane protein [Bacteroidota bacterium]